MMTRTILLPFSLLICFFCSGQTGIKDSYTVYINYPNYSIKAEVSSQSQKIKIREELDYFWYASNRIMQTRGGYDGKILNGSYSSFYLSNNIKEKGQFKRGLKHGEWISWFENGMMNEKTNWKEGVKDGSYKKFSEKGQLIFESNYKKGQLNGDQITYENEKIVTTKKFKNGIEVFQNQKEVKKTLRNRMNSIFEKKSKPSRNKIIFKDRWNKIFRKGKTKKKKPTAKDKMDTGLAEKKNE